MNKILKFRTLLLIIGIILICDTTSGNAMKRTGQDIQEDNTQRLTIPLTDEVWQKIFGAVHPKYVLGQVCKAWLDLSNFTDNWRAFISSPDIARTLRITQNARLRIYGLLLKNHTEGSLKVLKQTLEGDGQRTQHMAAITNLLHMPLSELIPHEDALAILKQCG